MIRVLVLAGGLAGAATFSQYPEFSQQYLQRLAGQVDALTQVVRDFDRSALDAGMGRDEALSEMTGTPFLTARQADMRRTFARHAVLSDDLATLRAASPLARLTMPQRLGDAATLRATMDDFAPAAPLSVAGLAAGGLGFAGGGLLATLLLGVALLPFRRGRAPVHTPTRTQVRVAATPGPRSEPVVERPRPVLVPEKTRIPRLMGEKR